MHIINLYNCSLDVYHHYMSNDIHSCLDYFESIFTYISENHQECNFKFSYCYRPMEDLKDVQS